MRPGLALNGAAARPTIERPLRRTLRHLLALPGHGWRRDEVVAVLTADALDDAGIGY